MGPHIDEFCGEICLKLVDIDEELRHLKITIREKARHAAPEVRSQLEKVMKRIACNQPKVAAARVQVEHWITDKAKDALRFRNEEISEDRIRKLRRAAEADRICCRVHRPAASSGQSGCRGCRRSPTVWRYRPCPCVERARGASLSEIAIDCRLSSQSPRVPAGHRDDAGRVPTNAAIVCLGGAHREALDRLLTGQVELKRFTTFECGTTSPESSANCPKWAERTWSVSGAGGKMIAPPLPRRQRSSATWRLRQMQV
jgi:hypothetical protein